MALFTGFHKHLFLSKYLSSDNASLQEKIEIYATLNATKN